MSELATTLSVTAAAVALLMVSVWLLSVWKRDASIVDVAWGPGFALIAAVAFMVSDGALSRRALVTALVVVWGLRLGGYLAWRAWGKPEDFRYQAMRRHWGARFPIVSLFTVFALQGVLMWIVSLPIQVAQVAREPASLGALDALGAVLWLVGMFFESVGDWQLARFKADPANAGRVMDQRTVALHAPPELLRRLPGVVGSVRDRSRRTRWPVDRDRAARDDPPPAPHLRRDPARALAREAPARLRRVRRANERLLSGSAARIDRSLIRNGSAHV
jgi:hypothetical protein